MEHSLDGTYQIITESTSLGNVEDRSDGQTEIRESKTERFDYANCKWNSTFEIIADDVVRMTSVADPSNAAEDFNLTGDDPAKREAMTFVSDMDVEKDEGGNIKLSGEINTGGTVIYITMQKIGD